MDNLFELRLQQLQQTFENSVTFRIKRVTNIHHRQLPLAVIFFDSMVNGNYLNRDIVMPLSTQPICPTADDLVQEVASTGLYASALEFTDNLEKVKVQIASGDCVIIIGNCEQMIVADIKGMVQRGIEQPDGETSVMGPHEGFNENIMHNLSLVKKRLCAPDFKAEMQKIGKRSHTAVAICYLTSVAKQETVDKVRQRLKKIKIDSIWDANYIIEMIGAQDAMILPQTGRTQRPDVFASKLCEGRVGLIINGTPVAITLPFLYVENFQVADDYYLPYPYANAGRFLRLWGFWLSFLVPAIYLSLLLHHPQMLPPQMLYSISAAQQGVPLSSLLEMLLLFGVFEILRETGSRMPQSIGLALNIVGAIVLGQAAVEAQLVSAPMVIIVAFSGTVGLMVRELRGSVLLIRIGMILTAAAWGMFGVFSATALLWCYLHSLRSLDFPYMYTATPLYKKAMQDTLWRAPLPLMNYRQKKMTDNIKRQGKV